MIVCRFCLFLLSYRIGGGFTRIVAEGHGLSDCFFTRSVAESHGFLSRDLSFGPTDQREVIIELLLSITRRIAEGHELSNYRIASSHGESRKVTDYRIIFTRNVAEDHGFFFTLNVGSAEVWVTRRGGVGACFCM